jgi:hypothetical protein
MLKMKIEPTISMKTKKQREKMSVGRRAFYTKMRQLGAIGNNRLGILPENAQATR